MFIENRAFTTRKHGVETSRVIRVKVCKEVGKKRFVTVPKRYVSRRGERWKVRHFRKRRSLFRKEVKRVGEESGEMSGKSCNQRLRKCVLKF